jgi:hypothetical protein
LSNCPLAGVAMPIKSSSLQMVWRCMILFSLYHVGRDEQCHGPRGMLVRLD